MNNILRNNTNPNKTPIVFLFFFPQSDEVLILTCFYIFPSSLSTVNAVGVPLIAPVPGPLAPQLPSALPSLPLSPPGHKEATPVIASVVSLASAPATQPCVDSTAALQGRSTATGAVH